MKTNSGWFLLCALGVGLVPRAHGQDVADIYLVDINLEDPISIENPQSITGDRLGYDNQPSFDAEANAILYSSDQGGGEKKQNDIYKHMIKTGENIRVTSTPDMYEFSPMIAPGGGFMSSIRAEDHGFSVIRLWKYDLNGENPQVLFETVKLVGYYGWYDNKTVLMFVMQEEVDQPMKIEMWWGDTETGTTKKIIDNPGRCFKKIPGEQAMSFVHKGSESEWHIKKLDMNDLAKTTTIVKTLEGSEDFVWTDEGVILAAQANSIYKYKPLEDTTWKKIWEFSQLGGSQEIQRLALSPDGRRMAFVVGHGCVIGAKSYKPGQTNPENPCQSCDPARSNVDWSIGLDGTPCDDGLFCNGEDKCQTGACVHAGNPCKDKKCNEEKDQCEDDSGNGCNVSGGSGAISDFYVLLILGLLCVRRCRTQRT